MIVLLAGDKRMLPGHIVKRRRDSYIQVWHGNRPSMYIPGLDISKCQKEKVEARIWNPEVAIQIIILTKRYQNLDNKDIYNGHLSIQRLSTGVLQMHGLPIYITIKVHKLM